MKKILFAIGAVVLLCGQSLWAQNAAGDWQGTLVAPNGNELRIVIRIAQDGDSYKGTLYSIDQGAQPIPINPVAVQAENVKLTIPAIGGGWEGKLNADGNSMEGTFSQGGGNIPLHLSRATPETAWEIPAPPPPPKPMEDPDPEFEVATIKPSVPNRPGKLFTVRGRQVLTINTTLDDLIVFAYGIHNRQIVDKPGWAATDKYDITAQPDADGMPNQAQMRIMMQKLLADRFALKFHNEERNLSVYAIREGDGGNKLTPSQSQGNLPGLLFRGLGNLPAVNATMEDFAGVMQAAVMDRPVVDQTGIEGRYDFTLQWTPDEFQFAALGGVPPGIADRPDAPPDLFTAMREQLGLTLDSTDAPAEVYVIDAVERPSEN